MLRSPVGSDAICGSFKHDPVSAENEEEMEK